MGYCGSRGAEDQVKAGAVRGGSGGHSGGTAAAEARGEGGGGGWFEIGNMETVRDVPVPR